MARSVKKTAYKIAWIKRFIHSFTLGIAFFLLLNPDLTKDVYPLNIKVNSFSMAIGMVCDMFCFLGLLITLWARYTLAGNWSGTVVFKEGHELIQQGPYRYVRHPIYTGFLMMFASFAPVLGYLSGYLALVLCFGSYWYKLRQEETLLLKYFPNEYPAYMANVKALIPFIL